ncbi:MAG: uridine diphosphate-N-acetylglucosamine-binding protein YvcK [Actinomycetota bacterium]|nr:uridine diphosphate-N-acetylglucosamine-binding protein YvcK [Actinomycetota bacterium]
MGGTGPRAEPTAPGLDGAARSATDRIGPRVVALGGGHGLATTLRAARHYASTVTAVVSVADDGGSSGRLRRERAGLPAPGDVRMCLAALASEGSALGRALGRRFDAGELAGHALGNILLAGLAEELGDMTSAAVEIARLIDARGLVLPATNVPVTLAARSGERDLRGERDVAAARGMRTVWLEPTAPPAAPGVIEAIACADQIVLGPGSLFTSVLAAAIVPDVRDALADASGQRVYVANLAPEVPETEGMTVADHIDALRSHGVTIDLALSQPDALPRGRPSVRCVEAAVAEPGAVVHDPARLADVLSTLVRSGGGT